MPNQDRDALFLVCHFSRKLYRFPKKYMCACSMTISSHMFWCLIQSTMYSFSFNCHHLKFKINLISWNVKVELFVYNV